MDLVEFVSERRYESITDTYQLRMVVDCIQFLKEVYEDESDEWVYEAIHELENRENYQLEAMLESLHKGALKVSQDMSQRFNSPEHKKFTKYAGRKLYQFNSSDIIEIDFYIHALLHVLDYFVERETKTQTDWILTIRIYENLHTIRLIYWINVIVVLQSKNTVPSKVVSKNNNRFDQRPLNQARKSVVQKHAKRLIEKGTNLPLRRFINTIKKDVEVELEQMLAKGEIKAIDIHKNDYVGNVSSQMYERWIGELTQ